MWACPMKIYHPKASLPFPDNETVSHCMCTCMASHCIVLQDFYLYTEQEGFTCKLNTALQIIVFLTYREHKISPIIYGRHFA